MNLWLVGVWFVGFGWFWQWLVGVWVGFSWCGGCLGYGLVFGLGFLISVLVVSSWVLVWWCLLMVWLWAGAFWVVVNDVWCLLLCCAVYSGCFYLRGCARRLVCCNWALCCGFAVVWWG